MIANHPKKEHSMLFEALSLAQSGWSLIPLHSCFETLCTCNNPECSSQGKHPRTQHGVKNATQDPNTICNWWTKWPSANIGISTGHSKLVVVDVDPRHGGHSSWKKLKEKFQLPQTLSVITGGKGLHAYFQAPTTAIKNRTNLLPGIDIRGVGGYVVAPPSVHASGNTYKWDPKSPKIPAKMPDSFIAFLTETKRLQNHQDELTCIPKGSRNQTLTSVAGLLRKQGFDQIGILSALEALNAKLCATPLSIAEIEKISKSISKYPNNEWPEPVELPRVESYTPSFKHEHLPEALRSWICDISDRMQVPLDFIAIPAICSLSSVIGRQIGIFPKQEDNWLVIPNLWGAIIARPGHFKSPAIAEALKPLERLVKEERLKFEAESFVTKAKTDMLQAKIENTKDLIKLSIKKGDTQSTQSLQNALEENLKELEQAHTKEKRFKTNDATIEKIGALLLENPEGLLIFRDELSGWLKGLQKTGREGEREFYLEAWNGYGSYTIDRIGRGTLHIPSLCLSIFGGLQPGKLESYIYKANSGGEGDDGLLQRFQLLAYPTIRGKWKNIDRNPNKEAFEQAYCVFKRLSNLEIKKDGAVNTEHNVPGVRFDDKAQIRFNEWRENLENRLRTNEEQSAAFESHLAKYRSMVPSLALIFHLIEDRTGRVRSDSLALAIKWSELLEMHARKVYSSIIDDEFICAQRLAAKIAKGAVIDGMTIRSIYRKCWSGLDTNSQVDYAVNLLEESNWIRIETIKNMGRPREEIRINPKLSKFLEERK